MSFTLIDHLSLLYLGWILEVGLVIAHVKLNNLRPPCDLVDS